MARPTMTPAAVARFVAHFERISRHIDVEMPARADLVVALAADRSAVFAADHGGAHWP